MIKTNELKPLPDSTGIWEKIGLHDVSIWVVKEERLHPYALLASNEFETISPGRITAQGDQWHKLRGLYK